MRLNIRVEQDTSAMTRHFVAMTSTASAIAISICLTLLCGFRAQAQVNADNSASGKTEYERGYNDGYQAGLRAAMAKSPDQPANGGQVPKQKSPANIVPDPPESSATALTLAPTGGISAPASEAPILSHAKSLWAEMTARDDADQDTFFRHSQTSPFWLSAQANFVAQMHPPFHASYSGPNSFYHAEEQAVSRVVTLFTGFQFDDTTELVVDAESTGWSGLSQTLGLAAYVNLDAVRNPQLTAEPYLARLWLRKVIPLSDETVELERNPVSMLTSLPVRRLDIHVGKMTLPDFFDNNSVASDSHMQFLNWAIDNNPAWDYAADTRGYTYGLVADYEDRYWGARFGEALEPTVANGINLEWNPQRAHSENFEIEFRPPILAKRSTVIRLLGYTNYANMGDYHYAIDQFEQALAAGQRPSGPVITAHDKEVTLKYGFGLNMEQEITETLRAFTRVGWNEGQHESWAYTECDAHFSFGADLRGDWWRRPRDKFGVAFVVDGLSRRHRQYLSLGGLGFVLGDGNLSYGPEEVMEAYYNFPVPIEPGVFAALDLQYVNNPGYNRARGPVIVPGVRLHIEL